MIKIKYFLVPGIPLQSPSDSAPCTIRASYNSMPSAQPARPFFNKEPLHINHAIYRTNGVVSFPENFLCGVCTIWPRAIALIACMDAFPGARRARRRLGEHRAQSHGGFTLADHKGKLLLVEGSLDFFGSKERFIGNFQVGRWFFLRWGRGGDFCGWRSLHALRKEEESHGGIWWCDGREQEWWLS